jgi:hypothetical protein
VSPSSRQWNAASERRAGQERPGDFRHGRGVSDELDPSIEELEWPPSQHVLNAFSSETGQWEERLFLREGNAAGTIADMRSACLLVQKRHAAYWKGEIYVGCEADFVMR